jgi:hypothetical protein
MKRLLLGLTILLTWITLAQAQADAKLEKEIAVTSIALFDDLCIKHAYDEKFFYTVMGKLADKKLTPDEYDEFFPPGRVNLFVTQDFYRVPVLGGKANIIIGWVGLSNRARNCIVILTVTKEIASGYWWSLWKVNYERASKLIQEAGGPVYFVNPGRKNAVLVQIGTVGQGVIYYSYWE